jgi:hypothetical protein
MIFLKDNVKYFILNNLNTGNDGYAYWKEELLPLNEGDSITKLSEIMDSHGHQLRHSPAGFHSEFHCTKEPQYVFILQGQMKITLRNDTYKIFEPGQHFYSNDVCPIGQEISDIYGHKSENVSDVPLITLFIKK